MQAPGPIRPCDIREMSSPARRILALHPVPKEATRLRWNREDHVIKKDNVVPVASGLQGRHYIVDCRPKPSVTGRRRGRKKKPGIIDQNVLCIWRRVNLSNFIYQGAFNTTGELVAHPVCVQPEDRRSAQARHDLLKIDGRIALQESNILVLRQPPSRVAIDILVQLNRVDGVKLLSGPRSGCAMKSSRFNKFLYAELLLQEKNQVERSAKSHYAHSLHPFRPAPRLCSIHEVGIGLGARSRVHSVGDTFSREL
jgi:hypothetical protein